MKSVWIVRWYDTGSCESEIVGVYENETKAEDAIADHSQSNQCEASEWEVE